ncbi:MAG TPA: methyltransferase domain-containing protein [Rhizomicrobium sp.]|nr:methyltransferase domain-containing protein [Rhizomicrobium sp.]
MAVPLIFDRKAYARRRTRASESFLMQEVAQTLAHRLGAVNRRFNCALELGARGETASILASSAQNWTRAALCDGAAVNVLADEESLPFAAECFDLIVSPLSLHAVNDLPGTFAQIRGALKPDGLFLAALFGGTTLFELREAFAEGESDAVGGVSPRVSPFADIRDLGGLLQRAGFALPVADSERTVVHYGAFETLVADLRALGETNVLSDRSRRPMRRDVLASVLASYGARTNNARLPLTFEIIYLTAWAPHESQPKPLRPGSADLRLARVLGTSELPAGDATAPSLPARSGSGNRT